MQDDLKIDPLPKNVVKFLEPVWSLASPTIFMPWKSLFIFVPTSENCSSFSTSRKQPASSRKGDDAELEVVEQDSVEFFHKSASIHSLSCPVVDSILKVIPTEKVETDINTITKVARTSEATVIIFLDSKKYFLRNNNFKTIFVSTAFTNRRYKIYENQAQWYFFDEEFREISNAYLRGNSPS